MAGSQTRFKSDPCDLRYREDVDNSIFEYTMNPTAVMRPRVGQCPQAFGSQCSFYGPMSTTKVHQESFLTLGLGTTASGCPGSEYRSIPDGTFPNDSVRALETQRCGRTDLLPLITRDRTSYGPEPSLREMEFTHNLIPGAWQSDGWNGLNSLGNMIGRNGENLMIQNSRDLARQTWIAQKQMEAGARSVVPGKPIPNPVGRYQTVARYGVNGTAPLYA